MLNERPTSNVQHPTSNAEAAQSELMLGTRRGRRDEARRALDIADFEALVSGRSGITRRELCELRADWNDRYIGEMAEHSRLVLSFPGSQGYRMISAAEDEEIAHGIAAIDEQVAKMMAKRVRFSNILGLRSAGQKLGDAQMVLPRSSEGAKGEADAAGDAVARELSAEYFAEGAQ